MTWLIEQLGFPWYAYIWPQIIFGGVISGVILIALRLLAFFVRPISWWVCWSIALPVAFVAVFWDVFLLSREANNYCRKDGGLHVYKTVEASGFVGTTSIEYWSTQGFSFVESRAGSKRFHITLRNGEPHYEEVDRYSAEYGWKGQSHEVITPSLSRYRYWTFDLRTNEILGELVYYLVEGGWADRYLVFAASPSVCGNEAPAELQAKYGKRLNLNDVISATLTPQRKE